jgi:hypothetical protein
MAKTPSEIRSLACNNQTVATVAQMRAHVVRLCEANGIEINYARHACAERGLREIWIRPVRSPHAYATALHEIGHILGRYQTASVCSRALGLAMGTAQRPAMDAYDGPARGARVQNLPTLSRPRGRVARKPMPSLSRS